MKPAAALVVLATMLIAPVSAAQVTKPIRYTWTVESCTSWTCAAAAFVTANGASNLIVLPTASQARPWLILRRVEEGSVYIPEGEPFGCEVFEKITEATSRFTAMDDCHTPLILNVPDGRVVLTSLVKCDSEKRRAVR